MARIPFPVLPSLISYAIDLVDLELYDIPQSGYISPDSMVTCLSTFTSLESLRIEFEYPRPRPIKERGRLPPQTRSALPALTCFSFRGVSEYLEDLVAGIDAPFLEELNITLFHQLILDTQQLAQFISRTPNLKAHNEAHVTFLDGAVQVLLKYLGPCNRSRCEPHAKRQTGSFRLWPRSVDLPCPSFPHWNISTSARVYTRDHVGKKTSRTISGWNLYIHLQL